MAAPIHLVLLMDVHGEGEIMEESETVRAFAVTKRLKDVP